MNGNRGRSNSLSPACLEFNFEGMPEIKTAKSLVAGGVCSDMLKQYLRAVLAAMSQVGGRGI